MFEGKSIAVVHGNWLEKGGGEIVAEELAKTFDAPLYLGFSDEDALDGIDDSVEYHRLFANSPWRRGRGRVLIRDPYYLYGFHHVADLHDYDIIIQSGNEPGWYVPLDTQVVVRYTHSTPRTPYDRFNEAGDSLISQAYNLATRLIYRHTTTYVDKYIANSEIVQRRIERYWRRDADVVYPPIDTDEYSPQDAETDDYYLTLSRLYPAKRIGEIIETFLGEHQDKRLLVAGDGSERERFEDMTEEADNIDILGYVSEGDKKRLMSEAKAFIFNAENEDFGIAPIEAMAAGTPVIGVRDGYTRYQITHGWNGIKYPRGDLSQAIHEFESRGVESPPEEIADFADKYSVDNFRRGVRAAVSKAVEEAKVEVSHDHDLAEDTDTDTDAKTESKPRLSDGGENG